MSKSSRLAEQAGKFRMGTTTLPGLRRHTASLFTIWQDWDHPPRQSKFKNHQSAILPEIRDTAEFYENRVSGLGAGFPDEVDAAMDRIMKFPEAGGR
jgi:hypothetical protein